VSFREGIVAGKVGRQVAMPRAKRGRRHTEDVPPTETFAQFVKFFILGSPISRLESGYSKLRLCYYLTFSDNCAIFP